MDAFPDPVTAGVSQGRKWFRLFTPGVLQFTDANHIYRQNGTVSWFVTYTEKQNMLSHIQVRNAVNKAIGKRAIVRQVDLHVTDNRRKWSINIDKRTQGNTLWQHILPCLKEKEKKIIPQSKHVEKKKTVTLKEEVQDKTSKVLKFNLTKVKPTQCKILQQDGMTIDLTSDSVINKPKKLLYGSQDITRKVFGKSRLCNHFVSLIRQGLNKPLIWSKKLSQHVKFSRQSDADQRLLGMRENSSVAPKKTPERKVEIPYDYKPLELTYTNRKLRERQIFKCALEFVALKQYQLDKRKAYHGLMIGGEIPIIPIPLDCINELQVHGLPADESLIKIFYDYCTEVGIDKDEMERGFKTVINKQTRMR